VSTKADTSLLREKVAATFFRMCMGRSWTGASPLERSVFLTAANQAIALVVDAIDNSLRMTRTPSNLN
jgi:hypothetical protein